MLKNLGIGIVVVAGLLAPALWGGWQIHQIEKDPAGFNKMFERVLAQ